MKPAALWAVMLVAAPILAKDSPRYRVETWAEIRYPEGTREVAGPTNTIIDVAGFSCRFSLGEPGPLAGSVVECASEIRLGAPTFSVVAVCDRDAPGSSDRKALHLSRLGQKGAETLVAVFCRTTNQREGERR